MKALILAAGFGTRLKPFTDSIPKACMPIFNLPQLLYGCELLEQAGVTDIIINTHHLADEVVSTIENHQASTKLNFSFSYEAQILDSGGGIKKTQKFFEADEDFFVLNADSLIMPENTTALTEMMSFHKKNNALVTMGTVGINQLIPSAKTTDNNLSFGAIWQDNNKVTSIGKDRPDTQSVPEHFVGAYVFSRKAFDLLPDKEAFHIFDGLIYEEIKKENIISYKLKNALWLETGNPTDFIFSHKKIFDLLAEDSPTVKLIIKAWERYQPSIVKQGQNIWAPKGFNTTQFEPQNHYFIGQDVLIEPEARVKGIVVIGPGQTIYDHQEISNSIVIKNSKTIPTASKEIILSTT